MKRCSAANARAQFSALLDAAEKGEIIVIERRAARSSLRAEGRAKPQRRPGRCIEYVDPVVLEGQWTWSRDVRGLSFRRKPVR
jgi:hypothetical protein